MINLILHVHMHVQSAMEMKIDIRISGLTVAWCIACKHVDITMYPVTNLINNS